MEEENELARSSKIKLVYWAFEGLSAASSCGGGAAKLFTGIKVLGMKVLEIDAVQELEKVSVFDWQQIIEDLLGDLPREQIAHN